MNYKKLGTTDINVSTICLGTMTWGEQNTKQEAHKQLDYSTERGVNFIDTAEMYPVPPSASTYATTEEIIGNWPKLKENRNDIILATKMAGPGMEYVRGGICKFNKHEMTKAVDSSLQRLQTDYIDLYQLHWPERTTNYFGNRGYKHNPSEEFTPFLERLEAMQELTKSGKIRHFGISNETPWGVMKYLSLAKEHNLPQIVSIQNPYNLLNRTYEIGLSEMSIREKVGLLAYSPLGFGVLSGKYLEGKKPAGARLTKYERFSRYSNPQATKATEQYDKLAKDLEVSLTTLALSYVTSRNFVTSNIIGATNLDQLKENIDSIDFKITNEIEAKINEIHESIPNPSP
jgi:aryl-alcohol dehydrogenase-like predicted oxidoreductase